MASNVAESIVPKKKKPITNEGPLHPEDVKKPVSAAKTPTPDECSTSPMNSAQVTEGTAPCSGSISSHSIPLKKRRKESNASSLQEDDSHIGSVRKLPRLRKESNASSSPDDDPTLGFVIGDSLPALKVPSCPEGDSVSSAKVLPSLGDSCSYTKGSGNVSNQAQSAPCALEALDHLDALHDQSHLTASQEDAPTGVAKKPEHEGDEEHSKHSNSSTLASGNQRLLFEAIMMTSGGAPCSRRDRLESWGGMSDLSIGMGGESSHNSSLVGGSSAAAAIATASALQQSGLLEDITAAANLTDADDMFEPSADPDTVGVPSRFSLPLEQRASVTSLSDTSFSCIPPIPGGETLDIAYDIQAYVAAAVASVGDQLAEIAGAVESAAAVTDDAARQRALLELGIDIDSGSLASLQAGAEPIIGAVPDSASKEASPNQPPQIDGRPRSSSMSSVVKSISVDIDAVAAAVDAAEAATGAMDLAAIAAMAPPSVEAHAEASETKGKRPARRALPMHKSGPMHVPPIPQSSVSEKEMELIRERARAAAGYVPPSETATRDGAVSTPLPPIKKRGRRDPGEDTPNHVLSASMATPKLSNISKGLGTPCTPASTASKASKGQSSQKWDSMFECLLDFISERKEEETQGESEEGKAQWTWDGNVPTTFRTKDGKALGRWINNQRSAKSKGILKQDREQRLVDAGLKWSVLASNSWNEMLEELRIYVKEQTSSGRKWDGNVPTNYRIKAKGDGRVIAEDKNLGRWVNRQRSLYQAGRLRKDRQLALEAVGLKWSMLATTSWESMFETLCTYVEEKTKGGTKWDGNVPANFKTSDSPPRALGRWINRQRSAFVKNKLKKEYVEKLNKIGLKWSVHERRTLTASPVTTVSNSQVPAAVNVNLKPPPPQQPLECRSSDAATEREDDDADADKKVAAL